MKQLIKKFAMVVFCMCFTLSPVSVSANKKVGMTGGDVDELRHDENEYADVIFKGQVKGETDKQFFYITAVNQKTSERFSFNFSKRNKYVAKGKLPIGDYEIEEGGADNDWTGNFSPENIKFSITDRSAAKVVDVVFGALKDDSESKEDREKIYQVQQDVKKEKKQQNHKKSSVVNKTDKTSERNFWITFVIGFILAIGILTFVIRFIKKFR